MIKKIEVSELRVGMYIHDLNCEWMEHPFLQNHFLIDAETVIEKVGKLGVRHVYIDTKRGLDAPHAPSVEDVQRRLDAKLLQIGETHKRAAERHVTLDEELKQAKKLCGEANLIVHNVLQDCRLGKQVELEKIEPIVSAVVASIFRNPDALVSLLRIKQADKYTFQHSVAVGTLLISFCRAQGFERNLIEQAGIGGLLHDVGKMLVPGTILNKPAKLSEREFGLMKRHVEFGGQLLNTTPNLSKEALAIVSEHHERFDGSGYPRQLKGDAISLLGQMASIVDVYDALTSERVYHHGIEPTAALRKILEWSEYHFDSQLVHQFIRAIGIYPVGTLVLLESGYLAVVVEQHHQDLLHPKVRMVFNRRGNCPLSSPRDIDLSRPGCQDRVVCFESAAAWRIDPLNYLSSPPH